MSQIIIKGEYKNNHVLLQSDNFGPAGVLEKINEMISFFKQIGLLTAAEN